MRLFKHSEGFIFSFGFNMQTRVEDANYIGWCDPQSFEWDVSIGNLAGYLIMPYVVVPDFVREISSTKILAYRPYQLLELNLVKPSPYIWEVIRYQPD